MVTIRTMPRKDTKPTMTSVLRRALHEAESIRAVAKATGVQHSSLVRFVNGRQSLRLDMADKLVSYFGVVVFYNSKGK